MKKLLTIILCVALAGVILAGCAKKAESQPAVQDDSTVAESRANDDPEDEKDSDAVETETVKEDKTQAEEEKSAEPVRDMLPADETAAIKEIPDEGDLISNETFFAQVPKNRYGGNCDEGDYAEGKFLLWLNEVILSDSGEILARGKYAVPYIVSDNGNEENLSMLSGGLDGEKPYGLDVWTITTDGKGEIINAELKLSVEAPVKRNQEAGYFVEHNGKVYYRLPKGEAMRTSALFGNYMSEYCGPSEIKEYDPATGASRKLYDSLGWGKLYVLGDYLVAWEKEYQNDQEVNELVMLSFDGKSHTVIGDFGNQILAMYDHYVVYEDDDYDKGEFYVYCLDLKSNTTTELGKLETFENSYYPGELQQFYADGENIWFTMSCYEGTGHFFSEARLYSADISEAGSLTYQSIHELKTVSGKDVSREYGMDFCGEFNRAPAFVIRDGVPLATEGEPGTAGVIYSNGVLMYYDNNGLRNDVADGYETFDCEEEGTRVHIELSEYVADRIFLVRNDEWRDAENDVGWREAYLRRFTYVAMVDPKTGTESTIDFVEIPLD